MSLGALPALILHRPRSFPAPLDRRVARLADLRARRNPVWAQPELTLFCVEDVAECGAGLTSADILSGQVSPTDS